MSLLKSSKSKTFALSSPLSLLEPDNCVLTLLIDRFDNFNLENNEKDYLIEVIKQLVNFLSILTFTDKSTIKKLTKYEKEKLAFFISEFFDTLSQSELERIYNNTTKYKKTNFLKTIYNIFLSKPVNMELWCLSRPD